MILETNRLYLREMEAGDFAELYKMLQDKEVMYAYEHGFTRDEAEEWLERQRMRYQKYGFGLWAVILKKTDGMIGQCGLTMQDLNGKEVLEVGYLFQKEYWHQGYAIEAARACRDYAFETLKAERVYSIIRENNHASRHVAERNGMRATDKTIKHYYNMDMPHLAYSIGREDVIGEEAYINK